MSRVTPHISEVLKKGLRLSTQDRGVLIDRLIASLDDATEGAWNKEVARRVHDIRSGRVKTIPRDRVLHDIKWRLLDQTIKELRDAFQV
jgi:putative addiction module component (TIGR02574 family)